MNEVRIKATNKTHKANIFCIARLLKRNQTYTAPGTQAHFTLITNLMWVYRGYAVGVASRLATVIYVAMVMPILYDNSYSPNNSNLKYESYRLYG